jgi:hypothetical protein
MVGSLPGCASLRRVRRLALLVAGLLAAVAVVAGVLARGDEPPADVPLVPAPPGKVGADADPVADPYAWDPRRAGELARLAAAGNSHALYALSPGGVAASAERTARWRPAVERAAAQAGVDPDTLEALVFLESAGREDARAPGAPEAAAGLTQILAETGANLLGMRVDAAAGARYERRLARPEHQRRERRAAALRRARARVDERFDGERALAATARYLALARARFGREDLAFVSYHMGIGNLESVLRDYAGAPVGAIRDVVARDGLSYARVYLDSTPVRHAPAYRRLAGLGDDSSNYLWKLAAAREIMRLWREDREELGRRIAGEATGEILHTGAADREPVPFPRDEAVTGLRTGPQAGEVRPETAALAMYVGAQVRAISGRPLLVVSAASGWTFDVLRRYSSRRQALAFQFVLDRLRSLHALAWVRGRRVIHVTASSDAESLLPLLDRL